MAPTKSYNTPGLCCAFAVIPDAALRRRFVDARAGLVPSIGALAYTAALAAYEDPSDWLDRLRAYLAANRDALETCVAQLPNVSMTHVEGTYLAWIDVRGLRLDHPATLLRSPWTGSFRRRAVSRTRLRALQLRMSARDARRRTATIPRTRFSRPSRDVSRRYPSRRRPAWRSSVRHLRRRRAPSSALLRCRSAHSSPVRRLHRPRDPTGRACAVPSAA